ncbi:MAG: cytochrome c oxidase assembly protein [Rhodobacteraceae bacterium]|nr:cytochrome c oxidase assembly protein [Paracoccaceae bacterium]
MIDASAPFARPDPYCGPAPWPETLLAAWNLDPVLITLMAVASGVGLWRLRAAADRRRSRALGVATGVAVLAFVSPLCALTVALFAARGLHHLLLIFALAPALALAFPLRWPGAAAGVVALSVALWAWHVPAVYALAWDHVAVYWALQGALILPAWAFWSALLHGARSIGARLGAGLQLAALAGQMGLIGAILTFAPRVLYPEHLALAERFGLGALADQQLAGLVMWVPGMVPLALAAGWVLRAAWADVARGEHRHGERA